MEIITLLHANIKNIKLNIVVVILPVNEQLITDFASAFYVCFLLKRCMYLTQL